MVMRLVYVVAFVLLTALAVAYVADTMLVGAQAPADLLSGKIAVVALLASFWYSHRIKLISLLYAELDGVMKCLTRIYANFS